MNLNPEHPVTAYVHNIWPVQEGECRRRYIRVIIHPTVDDLNDAANRYEKRRPGGGRAAGFAALGMFQPIGVRSKYDRKKRMWVDTTPAFAGVMRLARGHLTGEIVTHESVHAALAIWRMHMWSLDVEGNASADFGDNGGPVEESFAHLVSGIAGEVSGIVWKYLRATGEQPEEEAA